MFGLSWFRKKRTPAVPALAGSYDVFLSYDRDDIRLAERVTNALTQEGLAVWWDKKIPPGKRWDTFIPEVMGASKSAVVLWSKRSVRSEMVLEEAHLAREQAKLIPAIIEPSDLPFGFKRIEAAELMNWNGDRVNPEWQNLVREIQALTGKSAAPATEVTPSDVEAEVVAKGGEKGLVFLAYARADYEIASRFAAGLLRDGFDVFWDPAIPVGVRFDEVIRDQLVSATAVIALWSRNSVSSHWVKAEADFARQQGKLIPVRIDDAQLPMAFNLMQTIDLGTWANSSSSESWSEVISVLHALAAKRH